MSSPSRNIEIKARIRNREEVISKAEQLSESKASILNQSDTFYHCPDSSMRLKLRQEDGAGTLIAYSRPDAEGPKLSTFQKCEVTDCAALSAVLQHALSVKGVVEKQRTLLTVGQTRVHVDQVKGLGDFMELEVVLRKDQSAEEGQAIAQQLMGQLGVEESDLLAGAYMDMLLSL